jgi:phage shock protein PspC (stress-responsive transcriptional regulator)
MGGFNMDLVILWLIILTLTGAIGGLGAIYFVWWSLWRNKQLTMLLVDYYSRDDSQEPIK